MGEEDIRDVVIDRRQCAIGSSDGSASISPTKQTYKEV